MRKAHPFHQVGQETYSRCLAFRIGSCLIQAAYAFERVFRGSLSDISLQAICHLHPVTMLQVHDDMHNIQTAFVVEILNSNDLQGGCHKWQGHHQLRRCITCINTVGKDIATVKLQKRPGNDCRVSGDTEEQDRPQGLLKRRPVLAHIFHRLPLLLFIRQGALEVTADA